MSTPMMSYIEAPADQVIAWCDAAIDRINAERERRAEEAVTDRLDTMQRCRTRWMRRLPRWLYNPPEPQRADALAQLEAIDNDSHVLTASGLWWASEYAWQTLENTERLLALARTAGNIGSPVFLTADDHRYIAPRS